MSGTNEFENLPLVQVDLKLTLAAPQLLDALALLMLGDKVGDTYTQVATDQTIELPPGIGVLPDSPNALQYIRFADSKRGIGATIHTQMRAVRWSLRDDGAPYPRFGTMMKELDTLIHLTLEEEERLKFPVGQISYQNWIADEARSDQLWFLNPEVISLNLPGMKSVGDVQLMFKVEDADARIAISPAVRTGPAGTKEGLIFQTIVGTFKEHKIWSDMLGFCHEQSNDIFAKILSEEAKEKWGYKQQ